MEVIRANQVLDSEIDIIDMKEYREAGTIRVDYRHDDAMFNAECDYNFLNDLSIGDEVMLTNEDTGNLSPFVNSVGLDDIDYRVSVLTVTRKVYSPMGLDVYVLINNV